MSERVRREISERGWSVTFQPPEMPVGQLFQYGRDNAIFKAGRRQVGAFNYVTIINMSTSLVYIQPDFAGYKSIPVPPGTIITRDGITFQELNIQNSSAGAIILVGELTIIVGYEPPLLREKNVLAGGRGF